MSKELDLKKASKNVSLAVIANAVTILVTGLAALIVPKFFLESQYGYWQLYLFYLGYIGFFHLGLQDGMYLRYGGTKYSSLNKNVMHSQFSLLIFGEGFISLFLLLYSVLFVFDLNKSAVLIFFALAVILYLPNTHLQYLLQMTNRVKEYAIAVIIEKLCYGLFLAIIFSLPFRDFKFLLIADIVAKGIALAYIIYSCKEIVFARGISFRKSLTEAWLNISVGIKLLLANLASMLIVGVVRFSIEKIWDIEVFGKTSLAFSLCSFILTFITATGQVIFPLLCQTAKTQWNQIYRQLDTILTLAPYALLIFFPLGYFLVQLWLPNYSDSLKYLTLLLPMCMVEAKSALLINTYFKVLRKETLMLKLNVAFFIVSLANAYFSVFALKSIEIAIVGISLVSLLRCITGELLLAKLLSNKLPLKPIITEIVLCIIFVGTNWYTNKINASIIFMIVFCLAVIEYRKDIKSVLMFIKQNEVDEK